MQYNLTEPFFVKGGALQMKAIKKWSKKSYLKQKFNNSLVNIEKYKCEKDACISKADRREILFNDYLNDLHSGHYLADSALSCINVHDDIYKDIDNPNLSGPFKETPVENLLFIGKDTKTGAHVHVSPYDFVLHQVVGKKKIYLLDFEELTLNSLLSKRYNFSKENFFNLDKSKYNIHTFELEPGDILYLPPWIWHAVENIGYSIAVTKVFKRDSGYLKLKRFKKLKHRDNLKSLIDRLMFN